MKLKSKTFAVLVFSLALTPALWAQSFHAKFSTSVYSWERQLLAAESESHARLFQTARLTVGQLAGNRLSLHVFGAFSQDMTASAEEDPAMRLYNTYLQWRENKGLIEKVRLGRQRIYSGVAYGTIDGIDVGLRIKDYFKIGGFVGALVPASTDIELGDWNESHSFGLRVSTNKIAGASVLVSFMQRNRTPFLKDEPGRYTGVVYGFDDVEQRLVGLDAHRNITGKLSAYGRLDYDLESERVRRGQIELRLTANDKFSISGEFIHRAPLIAANSIFNIFEQNTMQDVGLSASYRVCQDWFLTGNVGMQMYEDDESVRLGLGAGSRYGSFGYNFRRGYGGQNNGAYAAVNYPVNDKLGLVASTGLARYSLFSEDLDTETSLTGSLGVNYRPYQSVSVDVLGQGVRNRFSSKDYRLFVRASYSFFKSGR